MQTGANTAAVAEAQPRLDRHIRRLAYLCFKQGFGGGQLLKGGLLFEGWRGSLGCSGLVQRDDANRQLCAMSERARTAHSCQHSAP